MQELTEEYLVKIASALLKFMGHRS